MSLVRYTPTSVFRNIDRSEFLTPFDRFFDDFFNNNFPDLSKEFGVGFFQNQSYPKVDVLDFSDKVVIEAEIPGLSKDEVSVEVQDDILTISGQKIKQCSSKENDNNCKYIRKELKHSSFKRSFTLSEIFDKESLNAKFENGLLKITLKKVKPTPPSVKKIKID